MSTPLSPSTSSPPLVEPFPAPSRRIQAALEQLRIINQDRFLDDVIVRELDGLPRPWDPANCPPSMRAEIWPWLERVAIWINTQVLWSPTDPGIPECWPAHPFIAHELATTACSRREAEAAPNPHALQNWNTYELPALLERIRTRLGDSCQPGRHEPSPRADRNHRHTNPPAHDFRRDLFKRDLTDMDGNMR